MDELIRELKREGVLASPYVEAAFRAIDRKDFVPPEHHGEAYANCPLPIGRGQTISQPYTVAFMLDLLDPRPGERILDVGAGSGWQTALLAQVVSQSPGGRVWAVERIPELCALARAHIGKYSFLVTGTVELSCGDASAELPAGRFDKIIAAAAAGGDIPPAWQKALTVGGTIVAPVGGSIVRYRKQSRTQWDREVFPGFAFVPLIENRQGNTKSEGQRHPGLMFLALFILSLFLASAAAPLTLATKTRIEIPEGEGSLAIGRRLAAGGAVRWAWLFVAYAALTGQSGSLKAGSYEFSGRVTLSALTGELVRGGTYPNERVITIPEGWDLRDIAAYFQRLGMATADELFAITGQPGRTYERRTAFPPPGALKNPPAVLGARPPGATLEGYLYPDTYRVFRDASLADVIGKLAENFDRKLTPDLRAQIQRQGHSIPDVLTMASILEQEVVSAEDRRLVAGILWRRLRDGMPLQVDATVNYISGRRATPLAADLAIDSPYNTYRRPGLPPGPISNPGRAAIEAAANPTPSRYGYYLSAPDGRTVFSTTLEEHAGAKAAHLR